MAAETATARGGEEARKKKRGGSLLAGAADAEGDDSGDGSRLPTREEFSRMQRDVEELGALGLDKRSRRRPRGAQARRAGLLAAAAADACPRQHRLRAGRRAQEARRRRARGSPRRGPGAEERALEEAEEGAGARGRGVRGEEQEEEGGAGGGGEERG